MCAQLVSDVKHFTMLTLALCASTSSQVGFGDILPLSLLETVVAVLIVLLGGLSYPAVISSILPLMTSLNAMAEAHKAKLRHLRRWLARVRVDPAQRELRGGE